MIEDLLREEKSAGMLTVVSNDGRVREAAKRRGAQLRRCGEYLDELVRTKKAEVTRRRAGPADEKDVRPTAEERAEWLKSFGEGERS